MSAPMGNEFWKKRSKHGRNTLFENASLMEEAIHEYFLDTINNPWIEIDYVGKDAVRVEKPHIMPFTMQGLCRYLGCNLDYFRQFKKNLRSDQQDFSEVITRAEEVIYEQKFSGAAIFFFNANIISRDLGLIEKTQNKHNINLGVEADDEYE